MSTTEKQLQIEVIEFLKGAAYTKVLKGYENKRKAMRAKLEEIYETEHTGYTSNEATLSEKRMMVEKLNIFKKFLADIKGAGSAQDQIRSLIEGQIISIKSQLYNSVTNSFGMSKDVPAHTEDDLLQWTMLHYNDFHLSIVSMMNPNTDQYESIDTLAVYENPEEYFSKES